MLHCGDDVLRVMRGVGFAPDIVFSLMAKKLNLLGGARCLVVLQTLGPFRTGVYMLISCDRSCDT